MKKEKLTPIEYLMDYYKIEEGSIIRIGNNDDFKFYTLIKDKNEKFMNVYNIWNLSEPNIDSCWITDEDELIDFFKIMSNNVELSILNCKLEINKYGVLSIKESKSDDLIYKILKLQYGDKHNYWDLIECTNEELEVILEAVEFENDGWDTFEELIK